MEEADDLRGVLTRTQFLAKFPASHPCCQSDESDGNAYDERDDEADFERGEETEV